LNWESGNTFWQFAFLLPYNQQFFLGGPVNSCYSEFPGFRIPIGTGFLSTRGQELVKAHFLDQSGDTSIGEQMVDIRFPYIFFSQGALFMGLAGKYFGFGYEMTPLPWWKI